MADTLLLSGRLFSKEMCMRVRLCVCQLGVICMLVNSSDYTGLHHHIFHQVCLVVLCTVMCRVGYRVMYEICVLLLNQQLLLLIPHPV